MAKPRKKKKKQSFAGAAVMLVFMLAFALFIYSPWLSAEDAMKSISSSSAPAATAAPAAVQPVAADSAPAPEATVAPTPEPTPVPDKLVFPGGLEVDTDISRLSLSSLRSENAEKTAMLLRSMPELALVDLRGSELNDEALSLICASAPDARFIYDFDLLGRSVNMRTETLDLTGLTHEQVPAAANYISCMPQLKLIDLGSGSSSPELSWEDIGIIEAAAPWALVDYDYDLWGVHLSTADGVMDLNHIKMDDEGAAVRAVLPYVYSKYLDMDSCGVSNEAMASLRDDFPDTKAVWRIWFSPTGAYTVRTDVTRILASKPSKAGYLTTESIDSIKYCTDLKYLDLGHNDPLNSIEFVRNMPHLIAVIIGMADVADLSPLEDCPHIEYLEIFSMPFGDISPVGTLKELKHLAIQEDYNLFDISPIMDLDLERFWIGPYYQFPYSQIEEFASYHPNCQINLTAYDTDWGDWKFTNYDLNTGVYTYVDRYRFLKDQMGYSLLLYSFASNDPKY